MVRADFKHNMLSFESTFGVPSLYEPFNRKAAIFLRDHIKDFESSEETQHHVSQLLTTLIAKSFGRNYISVDYKKAGAVRKKRITADGLQRIPERYRGCIGVSEIHSAMESGSISSSLIAKQ